MKGKIGRWHGAGMMATTLLGTGVFILPQLTINNAGSNALIAWILLTIAIIPVALVFGKLAALYPHAGGPAHFVEKAFGRTAGRTIGLSFLFVVPIGAPAAIIMTFQFVQTLISLNAASLLIGQLVTLILIYALNYRGLHISAKLQFFLTVLIVFVVLLLFGKSTQVETAPVVWQLDNSAILSAAGIAFWSFLGIEAMSHLSDDFKNPKKDMLPAMMIGICLVGSVYVLCTLVLLWLPNQELLAMVGVFDAHFGQYGSQVIGALGIAGGLATVNVYIASLARLVSSFAKQNVLPNYFAHHNKFNVPTRAFTLILSVMALVLIITFTTKQDLEDLINLVNGVFVIIYLASMLAAFRLLHKKYHFCTILGGLCCLCLIVGIGWHMLYAVILLCVISPYVYVQKKRICKISSTV